jgi:acetyltransferase-like isoleucine patch superfamily enzyme
MNDTYIHPTANVACNVSIGNGTKVWINVQIREDASIGTDCIISKDVYIDHGVSIGNRCKIQNSVSVYNGVTIFDDVFIGPHVSFTNDRVPRAFNTNWKITPTVVNNGVSLGANSTIICGVSLGSYSMVAAGSVVTKDVPSNALVMGNPARVVAYVCECGNKLDAHGHCALCKKSFKTDASGTI